MTQAPVASVVIPSYNHAAFIEAAVESVLASIEASGEAGELVIVDDGSTDDSREKLERFRHDPRVAIHLQENQGAHAALNRGIAASRGDVIFILNSDDLFHRERIRRCLDRLHAESNLAMVASWLEVIGGAGNVLGIKEAWRNMQPWPRPRPGPGLASIGDPLLALLETNYISTTSNLAFRREIFDRGVHFQNLRYAHDWDFILAVGEYGQLALIEEPLVSYRVHETNTISESHGEGQMRFEILWAVARHAARMLQGHTQGQNTDDLWRRFWNSAPRFGVESILSQLLVLRGRDPLGLAAYDALMDESHPFRRRAIERLKSDTAK